MTYSYQKLPNALSPTRNRRFFPLVLVILGLLSSLFLLSSFYIFASLKAPTPEPVQIHYAWEEPEPTGYLASTPLSLEGGAADLFDRLGKLRLERETTLEGGKEGLFFFKNLFVRNGTFYAISNDPTMFPSNTSHVSSSNPFFTLSPQQANSLFFEGPLKTRVSRSELLKGGTLFFSKCGWNGTTSPYHWLIELVLSSFMVFTSVSKTYTFPRRMINGGDEWRGYYSDLNEFVLQLLSPHTYMRDASVWTEMMDSNTLFLFDEIVFFDRWAAQATSVDDEALRWNKVFGGLYETVTHRIDWFDPMRDLVKEKLGVVDPIGTRLPTVTYINRQITNQRNMRAEDHEALVAGLQAMEGINLTIALLEELSPGEQISLALNTDIMLGLHGAGFTHMVWMKRGSALIEVFSPDSFARDYEMVAAPLGIRYNSIHDDTIFDWKADGMRGIQIGADFSSKFIPAHAPTILGRLQEILEERGSWS